MNFLTAKRNLKINVHIEAGKYKIENFQKYQNERVVKRDSQKFTTCKINNSTKHKCNINFMHERK